MRTKVKPFWSVLLNGQNFWITVDDSVQRYGFYANQLVQASDRNEAEKAAVQLIRDDAKFPAPLNDEHDPPEILVEELRQIDENDYTGPTEGHTFYSDKSLPYCLQWRCTTPAIDSLAQRFDLPNTGDMQDWEFEVSDPDRVSEFLAAFEADDLTDDEKYFLMNTIIDSIEQGPRPLEESVDLKRALYFVEKDIGIHLSTVAYWSTWGTEDLSITWDVVPYFREIYLRHRTLWEIRPTGCRS